MYLDQRSYTVLKTIANNPNVTGKELERELQLSRKQLSYDMEKINNYLTQNGFESILRTKTGRFQIAANTVDAFKSKTINQPQVIYELSAEERSYFILLRLLCREEELSTYHFIDELQISKNTLITDMKMIQKRIMKRNLLINYTRKDGYHLEGEEEQKRALLIDIIREVLAIPDGKEQLLKRFNISEDKLNEIKYQINQIEKKLGLSFIDDRVEELPFIFYFVLFRIKNGHHLGYSADFFGVPANTAIQATIEYEAMAEFAQQYAITSTFEIVYLTIQIQVSNIDYSHHDERNMDNQILDAATTIIQKFEEISCISIKENEGLLNALVQHLSPAYYRIKYHYHVQPDITQMVLPQYQHLHGMVKKASEVFALILEEDIPDNELVYITLLFGGWLRREGSLSEITVRRKAIVVCTNGISVSNFFFITLKELFPEFDFLEYMSIRAFEKYRKDYQIIFSTVRLETKKKLFMVRPILSENAKRAFRKKVMQELDGFQANRVDINELMDIVKENANISNWSELQLSFERYFNVQAEDNIHIKATQNKELELFDLLISETVQINVEPIEWQEAIYEAATPLVRLNKISTEYIDASIRHIQDNKPYIMIEDGVIIVHAGIDDGVFEVSMSLLVLPQRISINDYLNADIIVFLATPDMTNHLTALHQLFNVLESTKNMELIRGAKTKEEVLKIIEKVLK